MLNWFSVWLPIAKIAMLHAFYLSAKICIHSFFSFYRMSYMQVHLISHFRENSSFLIIFIVHIATWTYSYQNDNKTFGKNLILRKTDLSFHQVKEELWNLWDMLLGVLDHCTLHIGRVFDCSWIYFCVLYKIYKDSNFSNWKLYVWIRFSMVINVIYFLSWNY